MLTDIMMLLQLAAVCVSGKVESVVCGVAGTIEGDVRVSGHPKVQKTFARVMGYVEQTDIHSPNVRTLSPHIEHPP